MSDHILISGLRVATRVGWTDAERAEPQFVLVDVDIETDVTVSSSTDDLTDAIDYSTVISDVARHVSSQETRLLERLAEGIAARVSAIQGVKRVSVEVAKEEVPVPEEVARVAVRVERPA